MAINNVSAASVVEEKTPRFDPCSFIIQAETEGFEDENDMIDGVQKLIDLGYIGHLQGSWQRIAQNYIDAGLCSIS